MRKNIARKCLCIALASAMMLGEAGTAMAASVENVADGRTAATVAAEEQADVAAANVSIWYAGAYKNSRTITINASGRVGRSSRMAYAFLLYRRDKLLKEVAEKRLAAIREFTDLGSGLKIAMRDLEIRGAGNLLGEAQSGHMAAVGYDLYCKMLNEAVKELKGEKEEDQFTTTMDLNIDAFIPESYIKNEYQKLDIYKRIAAITTEEEMDDMTEELIDRFGDIPKKVQQLLHIAALKSLAHAAYVTAVEQKGSDFKFTLYEKAKLDPQKIPGLLQRYGNKLVFRAEEPPYFFYQKKGRSGKETGEDTIQLLRKILEDIRELRIVP